MLTLWIAIMVIMICFGGVLLFGAPYLPTLKPQIKLALDLSGLKPGETLLELGSGDGRVALAAAKSGYRVVGYELNPLLLVFSIILTWQYRSLVQFRWANFLSADWPRADAIFVFGLNRLMPRIDTKIKQIGGPTRLISFSFEVPGKRPATTKSGLFIYDYQ